MTMSENSFVKICKYSDLKEKQGRRFFVDDVDVAVFRVDGEVYALNNICIHQHAPIMHDGFIEGDCVACPAHGWDYELKTGRVPGGIKGLDKYEVKIENEDVYVKVYQKKLKW